MEVKETRVQQLVREAREKKERKIAREKERERKRKEKRSIQLRQKRARKYYRQNRKKELAERAKNGDEKAFYMVVIVKEKKRIRVLGTAWWKSNAYKIFNEAIETNRKKSKFKKTFYVTRTEGNAVVKDIKYEIVIIKKTKEGEETVSQFRNEQGKFVDNVIIDWPGHVILDKDEWYAEETFGVYGFHPSREKKTYNFILNELLLNTGDCGDEMKRVMVYKNILIIHRTDDFDFVTCFDEEQAAMLYDMLQDDILKLKRKYIVFMGRVSEEMTSEWIDRFEEKTGWDRKRLYYGCINR